MKTSKLYIYALHLPDVILNVWQTTWGRPNIMVHPFSFSLHSKLTYLLPSFSRTLFEQQGYATASRWFGPFQQSVEALAASYFEEGGERVSVFPVCVYFHTCTSPPPLLCVCLFISMPSPLPPSAFLSKFSPPRNASCRLPLRPFLCSMSSSRSRPTPLTDDIRIQLSPSSSSSNKVSLDE